MGLLEKRGSGTISYWYVLENAQKSAEVTHNHLEGIKGAEATASAIFLARTGHGKTEIKEYMERYNIEDINSIIGTAVMN